jgi:N-acetylmuramoyl-L-alanine amidase-like protein
MAWLVAGAPPIASPPRIIDRPLRFDEERIRLTIEYRRAHQDPAADSVTIEPRAIVLHLTEGSSAESAWRTFDAPRIEGGRQELARRGALNVSAHFLVDRDGTIWRLLPEITMARHCIGLNHLAIGIENVGDGKRHPLTDAQVESDAALVRYLRGRFPITHLLAHSEADRMRGHRYWKERDPSYRNGGDDPGDAFMRKVRARVEDLGLDGSPRDPGRAPAPDQ